MNEVAIAPIILEIEEVYTNGNGEVIVVFKTNIDKKKRFFEMPADEIQKAIAIEISK